MTFEINFLLIKFFNTMFQDFMPTNMRKPVGYLLILLLLGLAVSSFAVAYSYLASGHDIFNNKPAIQQLSVNGDGKAVVKPDIGVFSTSVVTDAKKIKDAQNDNTTKSNAIFDYLKKQGLQEKDMKTIGYSIFPQYQYIDAPCPLNTTLPCITKRPPEVVSYQVRHTIKVKVRDLSKVDDLLDGVVVAGASEVGSVSFSVDDPNAALAEARKKAIDDARTKAEVLARDLGVRLGRVVNFYEGGGGPVLFKRASASFDNGGIGGPAPATPEVQPGEQEIHSMVTVTYEFR